MRAAAAEPDAVQELERAPAAGAPGEPPHVEVRQLDLLYRARARQQVEVLEDEAELLVADYREFLAGAPRDLEPVQHALAGVRAAVTALIFASVWKMAKSSLKDPLSIAMAVIAFILVALFGTSPVAIVFAGALIGFLFFGGRKKTGKEDDA